MTLRDSDGDIWVTRDGGETWSLQGFSNSYQSWTRYEIEVEFGPVIEIAELPEVRGWDTHAVVDGHPINEEPT